MQFPRIVISGLSGGSGKTMVSLGLARAFASRRLTVRAFKKGPDYIDAAWLALAAGSPQATLDPFFSPPGALRSLFRAGAEGYDISIIEGNRGLFDGLDIAGSCSTAEVARRLGAPIILVVDCTKMTRTVAALVAGCLRFEPGIRIGGVILNRTGNERHQSMVRRAVEELTGVPVFGVLPRKRLPFLAERHMGLVGTDECADADARLDTLAAFVAGQVDLDRVLRLAQSAPAFANPQPPVVELCREDPCAAPSEAGEPAPSDAPAAPQTAALSDSPEEPAEATLSDVSEEAAALAGGVAPDEAFTVSAGDERPRIGIVRDAALWFYYQENIAALEEAGMEPVFLSLLDTALWPVLDGLYLGGGLPELRAEALAANAARHAEVRALSRSGLPIYAECGGFMYLTEKLIIDRVSYPMAGVFPCSVEMLSRPQGLGYVEAETMGKNPFHPEGCRFRGHEFHFSRCLPKPGATLTPILRLHRGTGVGPHVPSENPPPHTPDSAGQTTGVDGFCTRNTYAGYTHIFAPALPHWAHSFAGLCRDFRKKAKATR